MFTYRQLQAFLATLTDEELDLNVTVYAGDVDDAWPIIGTSRNTDDDMGEALDSLDENHPLLLL